MKKSLIALATLAAVSGTAFAQSSVTLSGNIKGGLASTNYSGGVPGALTGSNTAMQDGSSRFIFSGTEDLGGGLKANFQIDNRFRMDDNGGAPTSSPLATGNTWVGLSGGFGNVQMGKLDTHYCLGSDTHGSRATALAASSCGLLGYVNGNSGNAAIANASRSVNVIRYTSPNLSGFTLQGNYSTSFAGPDGAVGSASGGNAMHIQGIYAQGPLRGGLSFWQAKGEDQTASVARTGQRGTTAMIDYNFGVATAGLTYDQSTRRAAAANLDFVDTTRTAWSIPVTVKLGAGTALLTYTRAGNNKVGGATIDNTGATLVSVGYDYALSKRTSVGVSYARLANNSGASYALYTIAGLNGTPVNAAGQTASQLYLGVRHAF